jgi:hypothetical protein
VEITKHTADFDIFQNFPDALEYHLGEGECVYTSSMYGGYYLIIDSRSMLDLLDEEDRSDLMDSVVSVYGFSSTSERSNYLRDRRIHRNR